MLANYLQKYTNHRRITLVCIIGITECTPLLCETDDNSVSSIQNRSFEELKSFVIERIQKTHDFTTLKSSLHVIGEVVSSVFSDDSTMLSITKQNISIETQDESNRSVSKKHINSKEQSVEQIMSSHDTSNNTDINQENTSIIRIIRRPFLFSIK